MDMLHPNDSKVTATLLMGHAYDDLLIRCWNERMTKQDVEKEIAKLDSHWQSEITLAHNRAHSLLDDWFKE